MARRTTAPAAAPAPPGSRRTAMRSLMGSVVHVVATPPTVAEAMLSAGPACRSTQSEAAVRRTSTESAPATEYGAANTPPLTRGLHVRL